MNNLNSIVQGGPETPSSGPWRVFWRNGNFFRMLLKCPRGKCNSLFVRSFGCQQSGSPRLLSSCPSFRGGHPQVREPPGWAAPRPLPASPSAPLPGVSRRRDRTARGTSTHMRGLPQRSLHVRKAPAPQQHLWVPLGARVFRDEDAIENVLPTSGFRSGNFKQGWLSTLFVWGGVNDLILHSFFHFRRLQLALFFFFFFLL